MEYDDSTPIISGNYNPKEGHYWILAVLVFMINVVSTVFSFGFMCQSFESVYYVFILGASILSFVSGVMGLLLLYNGLFGTRFRGICLWIYSFVFEAIPVYFYSILIIILSYFFDETKSALAQEIKKHDIPVGADTVITTIFGILFLVDLYHVGAKTVIDKYRKLSQLRKTDF